MCSPSQLPYVSLPTPPPTYQEAMDMIPYRSEEATLDNRFVNNMIMAFFCLLLFVLAPVIYFKMPQLTQEMNIN